jgi:hypothetical protein
MTQYEMPQEMTREEAAKSLDVQLGCMTIEEKIAQHHKEVVVYSQRKNAQDNTPYRGFPPVMGETGSRTSNVERTGKRDNTLSAWFRPIGTGEYAKTDTVRAVDSDMRSTCDKCYSAIVLCEASADDTRSANYTRKLANQITTHTTYAVRIIHSKNDLSGSAGIRHLQVWKNGHTLIMDLKNIEVGAFQVWVENKHIEHLRSDCKGNRWTS